MCYGREPGRGAVSGRPEAGISSRTKSSRLCVLCALCGATPLAGRAPATRASPLRDGSRRTKSSLVISPTPTEPAPDQRQGERRSGAERRVVALPFRLDRRRGAQRRSGADRRTTGASPGQQLQMALELLAQVADARIMDDAGLRQLDGAILRVRVALERIGPAGSRS